MDIVDRRICPLVGNDFLNATISIQKDCLMKKLGEVIEPNVKYVVCYSLEEFVYSEGAHHRLNARISVDPVSEVAIQYEMTVKTAEELLLIPTTKIWQRIRNAIRYVCGNGSAVLSPEVKEKE